MRLFLVLAGALLAGCGGGGGGGSSPGSGIDPRLAALDLYAAQRDRVLGDPGAGVPAMALSDARPDAGGAEYSGHLGVMVEGDDPMALLGAATLSVDFSSGLSTGLAEKFIGVAPDGGLLDYAGMITLDGASVRTGLMGFPLMYEGTLSGNGQMISLDGTMTAYLAGVDAAAIYGHDFDALIDLDGVMTDGIAAFVVERD